MNFAFTAEQEQIRDAIESVCKPFDADYWLRKDRDGGYAMAARGLKEQLKALKA